MKKNHFKILTMLISILCVSFASAYASSNNQSAPKLPAGKPCGGTIINNNNMVQCVESVKQGQKYVTLNLSQPILSTTVTGTITLYAQSASCAASIANIKTAPVLVPGNTQANNEYVISYVSPGLNSSQQTRTIVDKITVTANSGGFNCPNGIWFSYFSS